MLSVRNPKKQPVKLHGLREPPRVGRVSITTGVFLALGGKKLTLLGQKWHGLCQQPHARDARVTWWSSAMREARKSARRDAEVGLPGGEQPIETAQACDPELVDRRVWCRRYQRCLEWASSHGWQGFACRACTVRDEVTEGERLLEAARLSSVRPEINRLVAISHNRGSA